MIYPPEISNLLARLEHADQFEAEASGVSANLRCACVVRFSLSVEPGKARVREAGFYSNGCGYMLAAAETAAAVIRDLPLAELKGSASAAIEARVSAVIREVPLDRRECVDAVINAAASAFAMQRERQANEFRGEIALICTCFAVSEDRLRSVIADRGLVTVEQVGEATNAGTGCGSCQMLIRELIDEATDPDDAW